MKLARSNAIISILADDDLTGKEGQFVRMSSNIAIALMDTPSDKPRTLSSGAFLCPKVYQHALGHRATFSTNHNQIYTHAIKERLTSLNFIF